MFNAITNDIFQILAVTISGFVFEPLSHMGAAFGKTFNNMFAELPVQLWIPAFVFVIIAMLAAILLLTSKCFSFIHGFVHCYSTDHLQPQLQ